jgi:periplasmic divalent cation tolerance protein
MSAPVPPDLVLVYVTYPDNACAREVSCTLLEEKRVACANILPAITSLYTWQGAQTESQEVAVIYKTRAAVFEDLSARITELHPYEVPCIVALDITQAIRAVGAGSDRIVVIFPFVRRSSGQPIFRPPSSVT